MRDNDSMSLYPFATWAAALGVLPAWLAFQRRRGRDGLDPGTRFALWPISLVAIGMAIAAGAGANALGLRAPTPHALGVALVAATAMLLAWPLIARFQRRRGAPGVVETGVYRSITSLPLGYRSFLVLTAGVTEELLYRGVGVGFGSVLFGNPALVAAVALLVFTLAHRRWGRAHLLSVVYSGAVLTITFLSTQDLFACMLAHTLVDVAGLLVAPALRARHARSMP